MTTDPTLLAQAAAHFIGRSSEPMRALEMVGNEPLDGQFHDEATGLAELQEVARVAVLTSYGLDPSDPANAMP